MFAICFACFALGFAISNALWQTKYLRRVTEMHAEQAAHAERLLAQLEEVRQWKSG